ncbi:MAG: ribonuclease HII [Oscillospiraceae bacterium]|nr:ribonuclease HII [Oscillospiraceae bacterium]
MDLWCLEREARASGHTIVCGVDEAGRGPLAGPVYAAAVILPFGLTLDKLDDSKKLSEKTRESLFDEIISKALAYGIAYADHIEVDEHNILNATYLAMNRAMEKLSMEFDLALIDGNRNQGITYNSKCVIGGDGLSASIAAASILAKVSRDRVMIEYSKLHPEYGFERHKGYGTKAHINALQEHGPCEIHRKTFLSRIL